jgi:hypothetical protein
MLLQIQPRFIKPNMEFIRLIEVGGSKSEGYVPVIPDLRIDALSSVDAVTNLGVGISWY